MKHPYFAELVESDKPVRGPSVHSPAPSATHTEATEGHEPKRQGGRKYET